MVTAAGTEFTWTCHRLRRLRRMLAQPILWHSDNKLPESSASYQLIMVKVPQAAGIAHVPGQTFANLMSQGLVNCLQSLCLSLLHRIPVACPAQRREGHCSQAGASAVLEAGACPDLTWNPQALCQQHKAVC